MRVDATRDKGSAKARVTLGIVIVLLLSVSRLAFADELSSPPPRTQPGHRAVRRYPQEIPGTSLQLAHEFMAHDLLQHASTLLALVPRSRRPGKPYVLPVARRLIDPAELHAPHHDYPAWDLPVPVGTRVVAVRGGLVLDVTRSGRCGNGVIILGTDGYLYTYCHGSELKVHRADKVATAQPIMLSGQSGHATGPHLHLQIADPSGRLLCPQALVTSWFNGGDRSPDTARSTGCFYLTDPHRRHHRHRHSHHSHHHSPRHHRRRQHKPRPTPTPTLTPTPTPSPSFDPTPTPTPLPSPSLTPTPLPSPSQT